jgi:hypothetical protein
MPLQRFRSRASWMQTCPFARAGFGVSTPLPVPSRDLCPDFSRHPLLGFALRSFSLSPGPYWLALSSREPYCCRVFRPAHSHYPRAVAWRVAVELLRPPHSPFGFRVLLPLRVRQPRVAVTPITVRGFPGFRLSKDFALHAPGPPSRAFRSRTCVPGLATVGTVPQRFALREDQLALATVRNYSRAAPVGLLSFLRFLRVFSA